MCLYMCNTIENTLAIPPLLSPKDSTGKYKDPSKYHEIRSSSSNRT